MRFTTALLVLTLTSGAAAATQRAEERYQPPPPSIIATPLSLAIAGFDRDDDMVVTRAEYEGGVGRSFVFADSDGDGRLSLIELSAWSEATLGNSGALPGQFDFDRDGDDRISREEFIALFDARFAALDKDKDKALRRSELVSFAQTPTLDRRDRERLRRENSPR